MTEMVKLMWLRIKFSICLCFGVCLFSGAAADDLDIDYDSISVGSVIRYEWVNTVVEDEWTEQGQISEDRYLGRDGKAFITERINSAHPTLAARMRLYRDKHGNFLSLEYTTGVSATYVPHNCVRTLGRCDYLVKNSHGPDAQRARITTLIGERTYRSDVFAILANGDLSHILRLEFTLGENGLATKQGTVWHLRDKRLYTARLVEIVKSQVSVPQTR